MKKIIFKKVVSIFTLLLLPLLTQAATLRINPSSGNFSVGQNFSASVVVSTPDQTMNAVSGSVAFPTDKLEVTSISKSGSVVGLWVQEPSFSNKDGTVSFEGVVLNPGFIGANGNVLGINFRAKNSGLVSLGFNNPAILANDGQGTDILSAAYESNFQINQDLSPVGDERGVGTPDRKTEPVPQINQNVTAGSPFKAVVGSLRISSPTHPDQYKWYRSGTAEFAWELPHDATGMRLLVNQVPDARPNVAYGTPIREKTVSNLDDGVWYLHAQARTPQGWGEINHFRFQIDTGTPESFEFTEVTRQDLSDNKVKLILTASDRGSGISHYNVSLDGQTLPPLSAGQGKNYYDLPELDSGSHVIVASAVDQAGNMLERRLELVVLPSAYSRWGTKTVATLSLAVPLLALVILLGLMLEHSHRHFRRWRRHVHKSVRGAESSIDDTFAKLRENIEKQLSLLERASTKRELTREESRVLTALRKNLRSAEKSIRKEVEEIEEGMK
ncbi:hypothetical protein IT398_00845 [Candidatus Nomurabacteria bacterium]|nr:hypothetical protein [Candidatus Nomurabacteria bacterium]